MAPEFISTRQDISSGLVLTQPPLFNLSTTKPPVMLRFLAPRVPHRSSRLSLKEIELDKGRSRIIFNDVVENSKSRFLVVNHLPPASAPPSDIDLPNSSLCPPFHIHLKEDETFRVISGQAKFLLLGQNHRQDSSREERTVDGVTHCIVRPDRTITIPRGQIHTFRNASSSHPLIIEFGFSPPGSNIATVILDSKMKRFFLNTQLYRSDCASQGILRSLLQVLLFNRHADVALVPNWLILWHKRWPRLRGFFEGYLAPSLGRVMNLFGGVILGRWMFGLESTYQEYCPNSPNLDSQSVEPKSTESNSEENAKFDPHKGRGDVSELPCQAWRDHSFDGQSDTWRN